MYDRVTYAESKDGLHFNKPVLKLHEIDDSKENNIVISDIIGGYAMWIDPKVPVKHCYKTRANVYPTGHFHMHCSPDGFRWNLLAFRYCPAMRLVAEKCFSRRNPPATTVIRWVAKAAESVRT